MTPTMSQPNMKEVNMTMKFKLRFQKLKTNSPRRRRTSSTYSRTRCTKRINLLKVRLRIPRKIPRIHKPMKKNLTLSNQKSSSVQKDPKILSLNSSLSQRKLLLIQSQDMSDPVNMKYSNKDSFRKTSNKGLNKTISLGYHRSTRTKLIQNSTIMIMFNQPGFHTSKRLKWKLYLILVSLSIVIDH